MKLKFYHCKHCGKIIALVKDTETPTVCCEEEMEPLIPGITDGKLESHVPVISVNDTIVTVTVGSEFHPMSEEHYIEWILLQTSQGFQIKFLQPESVPVMEFFISTFEKIISAYAYCNRHKLWKSVSHCGSCGR